jgi:hypothetical protein
MNYLKNRAELGDECSERYSYSYTRNHPVAYDEGPRGEKV